MSDLSKVVFLSYASQDAEAARRIAEALRAAGVEVWFDQNELVGGDAWDAKIRGQIASCALFVPVISANTQARLEGYFRLEWKLAAQRTHTMADEKAFLLPVVVDATRDVEAKVPAEFKAVQWTRLPAGETSAAFCARVHSLLAGADGRDGKRPSSGGEAATDHGRLGEASLPVKRSARIGIVLAGLAVLIAVALWQPRQPAASPNPDLKTQSPKATTPASDKSIAVLPFTNSSDDKENTAFFADGMHEDILTNLANIRDLRVISRTSVMEYRGTTKKVPDIARDLGVAYILEGSVRRAGNQVIITGRLIRAGNEEQIWANKYDRELTPKEMFAIQGALATEIARALRAVISPETKKLLERLPTENLAAYDFFLKGRIIDASTRSALREKEKLLQDAVTRDPNFAEAWGALAATHAAFVYWDFDTSAQRLAQADTAMARAMRLAPDSPEVILFLGRYAHLGYRDFTRQRRSSRSSSDFSPITPMPTIASPSSSDAPAAGAKLWKHFARQSNSIPARSGGNGVSPPRSRQGDGMPRPSHSKDG